MDTLMNPHLPGIVDQVLFANVQLDFGLVVSGTYGLTSCAFTSGGLSIGEHEGSKNGILLRLSARSALFVPSILFKTPLRLYRVTRFPQKGN